MLGVFINRLPWLDEAYVLLFNGANGRPIFIFRLVNMSGLPAVMAPFARPWVSRNRAMRGL